MVHTDYAGYQLLRNQCGIALAMGEREYDFEALKQLTARNALDLWQPDIVRLGGVEAWRESAALAEAFGLPVLPHYYKDYDVPLLCTVRSPYGAESFDWIDGIIDNAMEIENGFCQSQGRGRMGISFQGGVYDRSIGIELGFAAGQELISHRFSLSGVFFFRLRVR